MTQHSRKPELPDLSHFDENRRKFPHEELLKYADQQIAWSPDGLRILAGADDLDALFEKLKNAGIDFSQVVFDYVPDPNIDCYLPTLWDCDSPMS